MKESIKQVIKKTPMGNAFKSIRKYRVLVKSLRGLDTLKDVNIQFNNSCNLNCKLCSLKRGNEFMEEKLLRKILNDLQSFKIKELNLWNGGEPLMHPNIINLLKIIKEYKNFKVNFLTNGMLLNKKLSKEIINLNVLDTMGFSIDGGSKEKFEEWRTGAKWSILKRNIKDFIELNKGKIKTRILCLISFDKPYNTSWMSKEFVELLNQVDEYRLSYPSSWGGEVKIDYPKDFKFDKIGRVCLVMLQGLVILQNGKVCVCCGDINEKLVLGDIKEESLSDVFYGKRRFNLIKCFFKDRSKIPLCKDCTQFYTLDVKINKKNNSK